MQPLNSIVIERNLSGNFEEDLPFLLENLDRIRQILEGQPHEDPPEYVVVHFRRFRESEGVGLRVAKDQSDLGAALEQAIVALGTSNPQTALDLLLPFAADTEAREAQGELADDGKRVHLSTIDGVALDLYLTRFHEEREIVPVEEPLHLLYYYLASAYLDLGRTDEAVEAFLRAVRWDPCNADIWLEMADMFLDAHDRDAFTECLRRASMYALDSESLARCHRLSGEAFLIEQSWQRAAAEFVWSRRLQASPLTDALLGIVKERSGKDYSKMKAEKAIAVLTDASMAMAGTEYNLGFLQWMAEYFYLTDKPDVADWMLSRWADCSGNTGYDAMKKKILARVEKQKTLEAAAARREERFRKEGFSLEVRMDENDPLACAFLPELTMYVRDADLDRKTVARYAPGILIHEVHATVASRRVGGMQGSVRFAILSNHMHERTKPKADLEQGIYSAPWYSRFLVLDVYRHWGSTQILLLHCPNDDRWQLFARARIRGIDDIVRQSQDFFKKACKRDVVADLATAEWRERCARPVGLRDDGTFWPLTND